LANAEVQVGVCDAGRLGHRMWSCRGVDPTGTIPDERRDFNGIHALPDSMFSTQTGPDGTYRIDGLSREAQLLAWIDPGREYAPFSRTIATTALPIANVLNLGHDGTLDRTFISPREARFTVRYTDTQQPARGVAVRATSNREMLRAGGVARTDDE